MATTRRDLLFGAIGAVTWVEIATAQQHAHQAAAGASPAELEYFDRATAREVAAMAAQIVPSDDGPGATEAGAVYFIDRALRTFEADKQDVYRQGLLEVEEQRKRMFPDSAGIAGLSREQQIALLHAIENSPFFALLRTHTMLGFLGNPSYGGNRANAGWSYIGFDDNMAFEPPFGYYDAESGK